MKRSLLFFTSAVALGALTGFLISDFAKLSSQLPPAVAELLPQAMTQPAPAPVAKVSSPTTAFGRLIAATTAAPQRAVKPLPMGGLVLSEPVVIVNGGNLRPAMLPQGTAVSLVKNEGRFMSVRHNQSVLTVPRSAVGIGLTRAN